MSESADLARKLQAEGERFARFFAALDESQWQAEVYTEATTWTVRNILAHFVTVEQGFMKLFAAIRSGGAGAPEDFSIDRFNAEQQEKTQALTPAELLEQYHAVRAQMVQFVEGLEDAELERDGRHPFLGQTSLREMIKMVYLHNQLHYRDLKRVLR